MPRSFLARQKPNHSELKCKDALDQPSSQTEPTTTPGSLDLSLPSSLSSKEEEDGGRSSDPPTPEPVHTYAPRQQLKRTGVMTHSSPPQKEEETETSVTAAKPPFFCKHCNKEFTNLKYLKMHIRSHTLPCVCTTCGKVFSRPGQLRGHLRTHQSCR